nr:immunoglobulin heavy chain junction region [Macaca mulatta]
CARGGFGGGWSHPFDSW